MRRSAITPLARNAITALAVVVALLAIAAIPSAASTHRPPYAAGESDPFYKPPPGWRKKGRGAVLRSRSVTTSGLGIPLPMKAWQLLYKTTDTKGKPVTTVTTVIVPVVPYTGQGKRPLVAYQVAIDSLGPKCNPSHTFLGGTDKEIPAAQAALARGWAVSVSDYEGPRNAYTAGKMAGQAVLDGVRASERFKPAGTAGRKTPVGFWGYSGGGQATAWTSEVQPRYAPRLNVKGFAEGGVPPDIELVARQIDGGPFFGIFLAASVGLSREFPEMKLGKALNAEGRKLRKQVSGQCADQLVTGYPGRHMSELTKVKDALKLPRIRKVIRADHLNKHTPKAPLYVYHSIADELIPISGTDKMVSRYCKHGATVQYERAASGEHIAYAFSGAAQAVLWLSDRFDSTSAPSNC